MLQAQLLSKLRSSKPLIHNITNNVVTNYVANGLLALDCSPIMANACEEMSQLAQICNAVAINIGTLTREQVKAMHLAANAANQFNTPLILDPVGVGATTFRRQTAAELLENHHFTAVRGNIAEMAALADIDWQSKGVDAGCGDGDPVLIAASVAKKYRTVAVVSGAIDIVCDGFEVVKIANGAQLLTKITGAGCLHGAVCAAFIAIAPQNALLACVNACAVYAVAAEIAAPQAVASGSFASIFLDNLATLTERQLLEYGNISRDKL